MTREDIKYLIGIYKIIFRDYTPKKINENMYISFDVNKEIVFSHLRYMMDEIDRFVDEGRLDKAFRWLGFIQGVLFYKGYYSLHDLKLHNKPKDNRYEDEFE
jgi:hypothetical protein